MDGKSRWKTPDYPKNQIVRAGQIIRNPKSTPEDKEWALTVIDNWRASHAYPMQIIYFNLWRRFNRPGVVIAQRLKRLNSIVSKLEREPSMNLWTMQDLGGCRIVVPTMADIDKVLKGIKGSRVRYKLKREYNYIKAPRDSGYRSYHLVYLYHSDKSDVYNRNMLIEVQIRTHLQHLWATALETMGLFTNQALKSSKGDEDTLRFFKLISAVFAMQENSAPVPGIDPDYESIVESLRKLESEHNYLATLDAFNAIVDYHQQTNLPKEGGYFILELDYQKKWLGIAYYKKSEVEEATEDYNQIESSRASSGIDAVLVSVDSFKALKFAYPNYFSDLSEFIKIVRRIVGVPAVSSKL